jgi:hypothetical protein
MTVVMGARDLHISVVFATVIFGGHHLEAAFPRVQHHHESYECRGSLVRRCLAAASQQSLGCPGNETLLRRAITASAAAPSGTSATNGSAVAGRVVTPGHTQLVITPFTQANSTAQIESRRVVSGL